MALGDVSNTSSSGGNGNRVFDQTYYSRIRIKNKDGLAVGFSFNKGLLKLEVSEEKEGYRFDPIIEIHLSPTKAKLLIARLEGFINKMKSGEFIDPNTGVGVNSGVKDTVKFIAFKVTGNRTDVPEHSFVIGKVEADGTLRDTVEFVFNVDYDYSLTWNNVNTMDVEKEVDQFMGINTILDVLKEFAASSAGAIGASVWDTGRYDVNRLSRKMDPIYDKLGIERKNNSNARGGNSTNYFDRQATNRTSGTSHERSVDDLDDLLS